MELSMAEARIDLRQLTRNIEIVRKKIGPKIKLLFPVKADAYGHGAVAIARKAQEAGVDWLGVANIAEAVELRRAGIPLPILILCASRKEHIEDLVRAEVSVSVSNLEFAKALERESKRQKVKTRVQVKVDTGMGRNGILAESALRFFEGLSKLRHLNVEGVFSHFSVSYSEKPADQAYTRNQIRKFNRLLTQLDQADLLPPLRHIANSSGLIQYFDEVTSGYFNMVRPGILLYGYREVERPWVKNIKPILSMRTWITCLKELPPGRYIGYGRSYRTDSFKKIATIPIGYADGLSFLLANCGEVIIKNKRAKIVGGISMDQTTVDVTQIKNVKVGDKVEIISERLPADALARKLNAPFAEVILTAISKRVKRVYLLDD